ncbi:MAG: hypothetical protein J3Q66DRAFT_326098 [Benniella sp.]|nr:MAG: hypothetical protein J3Q66DRAFT_326098 [Benniella sp.]
MTALATVLDISLLLDMICAELQTDDTKSCAACCKAWYSAFGPYRFQTIRISYLNHDRFSFFYRNGHLIRELCTKYLFSKFLTALVAPAYGNWNLFS